MAGDIPPDFEKQWDMADIVLHAEDSDGKELHANKTGLALFSPYFRALFFHDFKEKNDATVTLNCGFATMKEILKIIHQVDFDYSSKGLKQYEAPILVDLYRAADIYDFPTVRKLCSDQMNELPSVEMAKAAMDLGLHDLLLRILEQLSSEQVTEFTNLDNTTHMFSKKDIQFLFQKITGKSLWVPNWPKSWCRVLHRLVNPQFDLTKPWEKSNIAIKTQSGILYGNLEAIDMVSRNFMAKVIPKAGALTYEKEWVVNMDDRIQYVAELDIEYVTMMEILSVIHHCNMDYFTERTLYPFMLFDMYRATDVNELDVPMIREMCIGMLRKQKTVDAWEAMCSLFGVNLENSLYKALSSGERRNWISTGDHHMFHRRHVTAQKDPLCNLPAVKRILLDLSR